VLGKDSIKQPFDHKRIYDSLIKETNLTGEQAEIVTEKVTRFLIMITGSNTIQFITSRMIREITCVILTQLGYEKARLMYTWIGMPVYDLNMLDKQNLNGEKDKLILRHINKEHSEVCSLLDNIKDTE